jgi:DNA-binding CsgD family transcriptional regulator
MTDVLFGIAVVNAILAVTVIGLATRRDGSRGGEIAQTVRHAVGVLGLALLLSVSQRLGIWLARFGVLPNSVERFLTSWFQLIVSLATTVLALGALWVLVRLLRRLSEKEAVVRQFVQHLPSESIEATRSLSRREAEVLHVMGCGETSDEEIAAALVISPHTAATHVRNIMKKTGVHNRRELMLLGRLLDGDDGSRDRPRSDDANVGRAAL